MGGKVKAHELRKKDKESLLKQLDELRKELSELRIAKVTGGAANKLSQIKVTRKNIARVLTVISQEQRKAVRKQLKGKKYKPLDIRVKKTRALRQQLSKAERTKAATAQPGQKVVRKRVARVQARIAKRNANFPLRLYALKA